MLSRLLLLLIPFLLLICTPTHITAQYGADEYDPSITIPTTTTTSTSIKILPLDDDELIPTSYPDTTTIPTTTTSSIPTTDDDVDVLPSTPRVAQELPVDVDNHVVTPVTTTTTTTSIHTPPADLLELSNEADQLASHQHQETTTTKTTTPIISSTQQELLNLVEEVETPHEHVTPKVAVSTPAPVVIAPTASPIVITPTEIPTDAPAVIANEPITALPPLAPSPIPDDTPVDASLLSLLQYGVDSLFGSEQATPVPADVTPSTPAVVVDDVKIISPANEDYVDDTIKLVVKTTTPSTPSTPVIASIPTRDTSVIASLAESQYGQDAAELPRIQLDQYGVPLTVKKTIIAENTPKVEVVPVVPEITTTQYGVDGPSVIPADPVVVPAIVPTPVEPTLPIQYGASNETSTTSTRTTLPIANITAVIDELTRSQYSEDTAEIVVAPKYDQYGEIIPVPVVEKPKPVVVATVAEVDEIKSVNVEEATAEQLSGQYGSGIADVVSPVVEYAVSGVGSASLLDAVMQSASQLLDLSMSQYGQDATELTRTHMGEYGQDGDELAVDQLMESQAQQVEDQKHADQIKAKQQAEAEAQRSRESISISQYGPSKEGVGAVVDPIDPVTAAVLEHVSTPTVPAIPTTSQYGLGGVVDTSASAKIANMTAPDTTTPTELQKQFGFGEPELEGAVTDSFPKLNRSASDDVVVPRVVEIEDYKYTPMGVRVASSAYGFDPSELNIPSRPIAATLPKRRRQPLPSHIHDALRDQVTDELFSSQYGTGSPVTTVPTTVPSVNVDEQQQQPTQKTPQEIERAYDDLSDEGWDEDFWGHDKTTVPATEETITPTTSTSTIPSKRPTSNVPSLPADLSAASLEAELSAFRAIHTKLPTADHVSDTSDIDGVFSPVSFALNGARDHAAESDLLSRIESDYRSFMSLQSSGAAACTPNPCLHNGNCTGTQTGFTCSCQPGYTGTTCQTPSCSTVPPYCLNGAICTTNATDPICQCPAGFTGQRCDIPTCTPGYCLNSGVCSLNSTTGLAQCSCPAGYIGDRCQTPGCSTGFCLNGGSNCGLNNNGLPFCSCPIGYNGANDRRCENATCSTGYCVTGTCFVNTIANTPNCTCPTAYTGLRCEITPCESKNKKPCVNGQTCQENGNSGTYDCKTSFNATSVPGQVNSTYVETSSVTCSSFFVKWRHPNCNSTSNGTDTSDTRRRLLALGDGTGSDTFEYDQNEDCSRLYGENQRIKLYQVQVTANPGGTNPPVVYILTSLLNITLTGLNENTTYAVRIAAINSNGVGKASRSIIQKTQLCPPSVVSFTAGGAGNGQTTYGPNVTFTIVFDRDTNRGNLGGGVGTNNPGQILRKIDIDALFTFNPIPLGLDYTGQWINSRTLVITVITPVTGAGPAIGVEFGQVKISGNITHVQGSAPSNATTPALGGNYGIADRQKIIFQLVGTPTQGTIVQSGGSLFPLASYFIINSILSNIQNYTLNLNLTYSSPLTNAGNLTVQLNPQTCGVPDTVPPLFPRGANGAINTNCRSNGTNYISGTTTEASTAIIARGTLYALQQTLQNTAFFAPQNVIASGGAVTILIRLSDSTGLNLIDALSFVAVISPIYVPPTISSTTALNGTLTVNNNQPTTTDGFQLAISSAFGSTYVYQLVITCSANGFVNLPEAIDGVSNNPPVNTQARQMTLLGGKSDLEIALSTLQITFQYSTEVADDASFISFSLSDNIRQNAAAVSFTSFRVRILCPPASVPASTLTKAVFDSVGTSLLLTYSKSLPVPVGNVVCSRLFIEPTLTSLGSGAVCSFLDKQSVRVTLGTGATVAVGASIAIPTASITTVFYASAGSCSQTVSGASVVITAPANAIVPVATITGPSQVSECPTTATLTSSAVNLGGRSGLVSWSVSQGVTVTNAGSTTSPTLTFNTVDLTIGLVYPFQVSYTNFLGQKGTTTFSVTRVDNGTRVPTIAPVGPTTLTSRRDQDLFLYTVVTPSQCNGVTQAVTLSWTVSAKTTSGADTTTPSIDPPTSSLSTLRIPAGSLSINVIYTYRLSAVNVGSNISVVIDFTVTQPALPIVAEIRGGTRREVSRFDSVLLDGSGSYDPEVGILSSEPVVYSWSCLTAEGLTCLNFRGDTLAFQNIPRILIAPQQLLQQSYAITLSVARAGRISFASQLLVVLPDPAPQVQAYFSSQPLSPTVTGNIINANGVLFLTSALTALSSSVGPFTYTWSVVNGQLDLSTACVGRNTAQLLCNSDRQPAAFVAGTRYLFQLTVVDGNGFIGSAQVAVSINAPPSGGVLTVEPSTGTELITPFRLTASSFIDPESNTPIQHRFFYLDPATAKITYFTGLQYDAVANDIRLPRGSSTNNNVLSVGVQVIDSLGALYNSATVPVTVTPSSTASTTAQVSALSTAYTDLINTSENVNNQQFAFQSIAIVSSSLSTSVTSASSTTDRTQAATLRTSLIDQVSDLSNTVDPTVVISAIQAITKPIAGAVPTADTATVITSPTVTKALTILSSLKITSTDAQNLQDYLIALDQLLNAVMINFNGNTTATDTSIRRRLLAVGDPEGLAQLTEVYNRIAAAAASIQTRVLQSVGDERTITSTSSQVLVRRVTLGSTVAFQSLSARISKLSDGRIPIGASASEPIDVTIIVVNPNPFSPFLNTSFLTRDDILAPAYSINVTAAPVTTGGITKTPALDNTTTNSNITNVITLKYTSVNCIRGTGCRPVCALWDGFSKFTTVGVNTLRPDVVTRTVDCSISIQLGVTQVLTVIKQTVRPPSLIRAQVVAVQDTFDINKYDNIYLTFDQDTNQGGDRITPNNAATTTSCSQFIQNTEFSGTVIPEGTVASRPITCRFIDARTLWITPIPRTQTLQINSTITLLAGIYRDVDGYSPRNTLVSAKLDAPTPTPAPIPVIGAPREVPACPILPTASDVGTLVLNGTGSLGGYGRGLVHRFDLLSLKPFNEFYPLAISREVTSNASVPITAAQLQSLLAVGQTGTFYLTVQNWFGQVSTTSVNVTLTNGAIPSLTVLSPTVQTVQFTDQVKLQVLAAGSCANSTGKPTVHWDLISGAQFNVSINYDDYDLVIEPQTTIPGTTYVWRVTATLGGISTSATVTVTVAPITIPSVTAVRFDNTMLSLSVGFDVLTNYAGMAANETSCAFIFDAATVALLGTTAYPATCIWSSPTLLQVIFGNGFSLGLNSPLNFRAGVIRTFNGLSGYATNTTRSIAPAVSPPSPQALIQAPTRIGPCEDLTLNGVPSTGNIGKALTFTWAVVPDTDPRSLLTDFQYTAINNFIAQQQGSTAIQILGSLLPNEVPITFSLTVVNWVGSPSTRTITVSRFSQSIPAITLADAITRFAYANQPFVALANLQASSCPDAVNVDPMSYNVTWAQTDGPEIHISDSRTRSVQLVFKEWTFKPNVQYSFRVAVTVPDPNIKDEFLFNFQDVIVLAQESTFVAAIRGGDQFAVVTPSLPLVLDGRVSYDPDIDPAGVRQSVQQFASSDFAYYQLSYHWECQYYQPDATPRDCFLPTEKFTATETFASLNTSMVTITQAQLGSLGRVIPTPTGHYFLFSLSVTKQNRATSIGSIKVTVTNDIKVPRVTISGPHTPVSVADKLYLNALVHVIQDNGQLETPYPVAIDLDEVIKPANASAGALTSGPKRWSVIWSVITDGGAPVDFTSPSTFALPSGGRTNPTLIINGDILQPGLKYKFTVSVTDNSRRALPGLASFEISTAPRPQGGTCSITVPTQATINTTFIATCNNWNVPETDTPIQYSFALFNKNTFYRQQIGFWQGANSVALKFPPGDLILYAQIRTRAHAIAIVPLTITITSPSATTWNTTVATIVNKMPYYIRYGQINDMSQAIVQANAILLQSQTTDTSSTANEQRTAWRTLIAQYIVQMNARNEDISTYAETITRDSQYMSLIASQINEMNYPLRQQALSFLSTEMLLAMALTPFTGSIFVQSPTDGYPLEYGANSLDLFDPLTAIQVMSSMDTIMKSNLQTYVPRFSSVSGEDGYTAYQQAKNLSMMFEMTIPRIGVALQRSNVHGEPRIDYTSESKSLFLSSKRVLPSELNNYYYNYNTNPDGPWFRFPNDISNKLTPRSEYIVVMYVYDRNIYNYSDQAQQGSVSSIASSVGLSVHDTQNFGFETELKALATPIEFSLPLTQTVLNSSIEAPYCRYWDVTNDKWSQDGLTLVPPTAANINATRCQTTHLTVFNIGKGVPGSPIKPLPNSYDFTGANLVSYPYPAIAVMVIYGLFLLLLLLMLYRDRTLDQEGIMELYDNEKMRAMEGDRHQELLKGRDLAIEEQVNMSGMSKMKYFGKRFIEQHLWFSMWWRAPGSNYTSAARLLVTTTFVLTTMAIMAIFFGYASIITDLKNDLAIATIVACIAAPITYLIIRLFGFLWDYDRRERLQDYVLEYMESRAIIESKQVIASTPKLTLRKTRNERKQDRMRNKTLGAPDSVVASPHLAEGGAAAAGPNDRGIFLRAWYYLLEVLILRFKRPTVRLAADEPVDITQVPLDNILAHYRSKRLCYTTPRMYAAYFMCLLWIGGCTVVILYFGLQFETIQGVPGTSTFGYKSIVVRWLIACSIALAIHFAILQVLSVVGQWLLLWIMLHCCVARRPRQVHDRHQNPTSMYRLREDHVHISEWPLYAEAPDATGVRDPAAAPVGGQPPHFTLNLDDFKMIPESPVYLYEQPAMTGRPSQVDIGFTSTMGMDPNNEALGQYGGVYDESAYENPFGGPVMQFEEGEEVVAEDEVEQRQQQQRQTASNIAPGRRAQGNIVVSDSPLAWYEQGAGQTTPSQTQPGGRGRGNSRSTGSQQQTDAPAAATPRRSGGTVARDVASALSGQAGTPTSARGQQGRAAPRPAFTLSSDDENTTSTDTARSSLPPRVYTQASGTTDKNNSALGLSYGLPPRTTIIEARNRQGRPGTADGESRSSLAGPRFVEADTGDRQGTPDRSSGSQSRSTSSRSGSGSSGSRSGSGSGSRSGSGSGSRSGSRSGSESDDNDVGTPRLNDDSRSGSSRSGSRSGSGSSRSNSGRRAPAGPSSRAPTSTRSGAIPYVDEDGKQTATSTQQPARTKAALPQILPMRQPPKDDKQ